jgi:hypothetical protein
MPSTTKPSVAIVTGASSGIGAATARRLAELGFKVTLAARRADKLAGLAESITTSGGHAIAITTDVTDRRAVEAMVDFTVESFGPVDLLVNNAGVMPLSPIQELRVADWEQMIDINVKGVLYCIAAVLPPMIERRAGHIINVSSVAGRRPLPAGTVYAASKFAVRAISQGLRLELSATHGLRVTDIEPGVVQTELMDHIPDRATREGFRDSWSRKSPLQPQDIANAIAYAATQPAHVNVNEILVRPTDQAT